MLFFLAMFHVKQNTYFLKEWTWLRVLFLFEGKTLSYEQCFTWNTWHHFEKNELDVLFNTIPRSEIDVTVPSYVLPDKQTCAISPKHVVRFHASCLLFFEYENIKKPPNVYKEVRVEPTDLINGWTTNNLLNECRKRHTSKRLRVSSQAVLAPYAVVCIR